jgi:cysteine desulfurase
MRYVYLDNQSNTQLSESVFEAMLPYFRERYGNPQSMYSLGAQSKDALETARQQTGALIGAPSDSIYFTSCGSESNNLALKGVAEAYRQKGRHIVVSEVEHFSVLNAAKRLAQQQGFEVTAVPVDKSGLVSPDDVRAALRPDTVLVSIQHANTEIGTIQPIAEIARAAHEKDILFHTDAVCTAGTIPVNVQEIGADLLTLAGSAMHGPKGAAALYVRKGVRLVPQIDGGIQENGRRAGTENVPAIVGLGAACAEAAAGMDANAALMRRLRDRLIKELPQAIDHIYLNGHPERRLPGNVNFSVEFVEGEGMFLLLDQKGILVSSGSACANKALKMSHVLSAIKLDAAVGQGSILMSLSKCNTDADIDYVLAEFPPIVARLRALSPLYSYFLKTGKRHVAGPGTDYEHDHDHEHGQDD